jgi:predicted glycosyltransferase
MKPVSIPLASRLQQQGAGPDGPATTMSPGETSVQPVPSTPKRVWIDLDNSPHVPFFAPIVEELEKRGYSVTLTARDAYQVRELADLFQFRYRCVGRHWGKHRILKVFGTCLRALQLIPMVARQRPDLAVSHGSRSQTIASVLLGIPSLCIFDYEFASFMVLMKPTFFMSPEIIPMSESMRKTHRLLQYPGIKEDVYVPTFKPDSSIRSRLGLDERNLIVVVRPPATEAHYHNPKSDELFAATIEYLGHMSDVQVVVLPRNQRQAASVRKAWPEWFASGKLSIPEHPEDGLNLMWHSDLVISGGGTMNREAAALGIPVYSIFRGEIGAVDRYLSDTGRLVLIESVEDLRTKVVLQRWSRPAEPQNIARAALAKVVDDIIQLTELKG